MYLKTSGSVKVRDKNKKAEKYGEDPGKKIMKKKYALLLMGFNAILIVIEVERTFWEERCEKQGG
ncbi:MAG: hypothetical protein ACLS6H_14430 [Clostridium sp.]